MQHPKFNLTTSDLESFKRSYLRREDLVEAGIYRVDRHTGKEIVGGRSDDDYSGFVFPNYFPGRNSPRANCLRLDNPPLERKSDGSIKEKGKYRNEPGRSNLLYIPRGTPLEWLSDTTVDVFITEGQKKTLALWRLSKERETLTLCVGLSGVWNWRGVVGSEGDASGNRREVRGPIDDLDNIDWKDRIVTIIFDANTATNQSVDAARNSLAKELRARGANVFLLDLPQDVDGVNGIDDLLFVKGPDFVAELIDYYSYDPKLAQLEKKPDKQPSTVRALRTVRMLDVVPEEVEWLWQPYIPIGKLTMLQGVEGVGKSWLMTALAAAISRGRGLPGAGEFPPGNVLLMSAEDGLADTIRPRLEKAGADLARIHAVDEPLSLDEIGLMRLESCIEQHKPLLVGIDPLFAYTGARLDINRANECRSLGNWKCVAGSGGL